VSERDSDRAFEELLGRYREAHRHYHTVKHLSSVLATADEILATVSGSDPTAVRLALFFHDAVYDPRSTTNEADSAEVARRVLGELGVDQSRVDAVAALVEATASHDNVAGDRERAVVNDADLAILAASPAVYGAYVNGVRAEYAHVDDAAWRVGRSAVLRELLARAAIFATEPMRAHEARARANLAAELVAMKT
jgi:predicted metal-dependent HD superfamily phosphohydrolase